MVFTKWLIRCMLLLCSFCEGNTLYTARTKLIDNTWNRQDACTFNFTIQDATQAYGLYLVLQYMPDFPYQNLQLTYQLQNDHGNLLSRALTNHLLFDPKTGKPVGKGWRKKKWLKLPLINNYHFEKTGEYSLALVQFMRTEQLPGIASVGIQLCKSQSKTH